MVVFTEAEDETNIEKKLSKENVKRIQSSYALLCRNQYQFSVSLRFLIFFVLRLFHVRAEQQRRVSSFYWQKVFKRKW